MSGAENGAERAKTRVGLERSGAERSGAERSGERRSHRFNAERQNLPLRSHAVLIRNFETKAFSSQSYVVSTERCSQSGDGVTVTLHSDVTNEMI